MNASSIFAITNLSIAIISFILGFFAYIKNKKNFVNIFWFFASIFISIWSLSLYAVVTTNSEFFANYWQYLLDSSAIFVPALFLLFVIAVVGKNFNKKFFLLLMLPALLVSIFSFFPCYRVGMTQTFIFDYWVDPGSCYLIAPIFYLLYVLSSLIFLILNIRKTHGSKKQQLIYIFLAALIGFTGGATNYLPQTFGIYPFGNYFIIFYVVFITYAIVKHRLMDIRMVVARSVVYSILIAILAGFYAASVLAIEAFLFPDATQQIDFTHGAIRTVLAVLMAFSFQPLKRFITRFTDNIFFKEQYDAEEFFDEMAHTVGSSIILIEMIYKTLSLAIDRIKITRGIVVVLDDSGKILESQSVGYKKSINIDPRDMESLARDGIVIADEISDNSKYKKILNKYDATVSVPLKTDSGTEGAILFGEKQSGDMYSVSDVKVFEIIAPEIAVAITNAKAYEKIEKFNVTLRQEVKKATHELEKKNEQLRELDRAKDEFISMASHQLRTPLTAIKGYLSMLLEGDAGEIKVSQYDFVNEAFQGANRMVGLINDLLNVSRMETGRFFLEPSEIDMAKIVEEEVKQLSKQVKEKGLKMDIDVKGKIPKIWADETKIRQVIMNFADNAVYYTTKGEIQITLEADKKYVTYKVKDTGIGVPKSQQKNLFTKFYRADNARHVRPDGTGLGIYLAKKVIDDHGGEIIFKSEEGKGSVFGFKIPIQSSLKIKRVSAPQPRVHTTKPEIGELAAGIGIDPKVLEATEKAGLEPPLADSTDNQELTKEVIEK